MLADRQQHERQRKTLLTCFVVEVSGVWRTGALLGVYCITSLVKFAVPGQILRQLSHHYGAGGLVISKTQTQTV
jgi:hypothetical protein